MSQVILAALVALGTCAGISGNTLCAAEPGVRVVNPDGQPIPAFEQMVFTNRGSKPMWTNQSDGVGRVTVDDPPPPAIHVLVRADGYSVAGAKFEGKTLDEITNGTATIVLQPGKEVTLELRAPDGVKLPDDLQPYTFSTDAAPSGLFPWNYGNGAPEQHDRDLLSLKKLGNGRFAFRISDSHPKFGVTIYHPGFLRYFETGPLGTTDIKDGLLSVSLPKPASLTVSLATDRLNGAEKPYSRADVSTLWEKGPTTLFVPLLGQSVNLTEPIEVNDLAPGKFIFHLMTRPKNYQSASTRLETSASDIPDPGLFRDQRKVTIEAGQRAAVTFEYIPFDPQAFVGEYAANVKVLTPSGKPATGREVKVTYFDSYYGGLTAYEGILPDDGILHLQHLTDKVVGAKVTRPFAIACGTDRLGSFRINPDGRNEFEYRLAPVAGDEAPDIEFTEVATGAKHRLQDYRGKLVVLEFWATWCGPCQKPMTNLNREAKERADSWRDQVVMLPLSIDNEIDAVAPHIQKAGWNSLSFVWSGGELNGFNCPAATIYSLQGVPTSLLIGRDGKIIWRGHPSAQFGGAELADRVDAALKGEPQVASPK